MENIIKRLCSLLFAVSLVCLQTVPVFAEETETATLGHSSVLDSGSGETQDGDTVSTWDELVVWMDAHVTEGGSVRLTAPIAFDGAYAAVTRNPGAQPAMLDLGEYGITISGSLELYCPGLTIRGQGGESASLRALSGGSVALGYIEAQPGENGAVLWQDEGGILALEQPVTEDAVHFAARSIAEPTVLTPEVITVMPGEYAADKLPQTVQANVYFEGDAQVEELPVIWNLTDEETAESLSERRRTLVFGEFADMDTFGVISCILTFLDRPITFTDVIAENARGIRMIEADFTRPADTFTAAVEYSFDEELWETAERLEFTASEKATIQMHFYEPDEAQDGDLIWDTAQNPTLYLRIRWLDAENETDAYSDELAFDGETMKVSSDTGGNRGGGTDLDPPVTLPPPIGGDGIGGGDDSTPETPDPPPETPSGGGSTSDSESGSSGDTPPPHHPDTVPSEPPKIEETPLPPVSSTASIPVTVADKADAVTAQTERDSDETLKSMLPEQASSSPPSAEQSEPAQAALAPAAPEPPPASNRAVGQAMAGTAATGGVIALTMTYSHWGGRFAAFLRRLIGKH